ncbi:1,6-anhydro-N-acetylmuramyl-L-alanine amidase AmpD [Acidihalobacter prosperus]|uniref:1,6-anhydro-N-acetylmuramyl-L-alanine amidase AmpD n=1 Tax=Acidihalobacter prosperus TaxID=160660 RepID=A0A1A6C1X1_9GAMM|nr:1,6-anhydro-N-acetylmuramyl-L-alanine amidase AmpD [Acidihalobacter prosperus]OBS08549.1 N-acetyl-anhydromuranmyl-L-alanine amidase [Acidihalobacter prosperus]
MRIDPSTGLTDAARWCASPNADERPEGTLPELAVIHNISLPPGEFGGPWIEALFTNRLPPRHHPYFAAIADLQVSAHALIRRDGELIQYVPWHRRAWHAGLSCWNGRERCNDFSVGIELEGTDDLPYEPIQYRRLAELLGALFAAYPTLSPERVVGHADISPGRKTDPGESFDWRRLRAELDKRLASSR